MGSPIAEPGRGASTEDEVATTLTRAFVIGQHEVSQEMWSSLIEQNPSGGTKTEERRGEPWEMKSIIGDDYPVDNVSWLEAVFFANALSESEGRPACYELVDCTDEVGLQEFRVAGSKTSVTFDCADVKLTAETLYECQGYRLPTEAEWEYAARAGTRTAYYSGEVPAELENDRLGCDVCAPHVDQIGWHCGNSGLQSHPVGQKLANQWGLFDMTGNVMEWVHDERPSAPGPPPWTDPVGTMHGTWQGLNMLRRFKGGVHWAGPTIARLANSSANNWDSKFIAHGFRLVRTLGENEEW